MNQEHDRWLIATALTGAALLLGTLSFFWTAQASRISAIEIRVNGGEQTAGTLRLKVEHRLTRIETKLDRVLVLVREKAP